MTKVSKNQENDIINKKISDNLLRKVQSIQFDILNEVVRIIEKHNLNYYLDGGTLLGAVRHNGFIPWDDDIDIVMPRDDYEKFLKFAPKEICNKYKVRHYTLDETYTGYYISVASKEYKAIVKKTTPVETFVGIDIEALDGIPENKVSFLLFKFKILWRRLLVMFINVDHLRIIKRSLVQKLLIGFAKITHIGKILKLRNVRKKQEKHLKSHEYNKYSIVGAPYDYYGFKYICKKEWYGKGKKVTFEGKQYNAPEHTHEVLKHFYGDYMQLPPVEKRIGHHILSVEKIKIED